MKTKTTKTISALLLLGSTLAFGTGNDSLYMGKFVPTSSVINSVSKTANKINSQGIDYFLDFGVKVSNKLTQYGVSSSSLNSYFVNPYLNLGIGVEKVATNIGRYSYVYGSILSNNMSSGGSSLLSVGYSWMPWPK